MLEGIKGREVNRRSGDRYTEGESDRLRVWTLRWEKRDWRESPQ